MKYIVSWIETVEHKKEYDLTEDDIKNLKAQLTDPKTEDRTLRTLQSAGDTKGRTYTELVYCARPDQIEG